MMVIKKISRTVLLALLFLVVATPDSIAQEAEKEEDEINFIWIDTIIMKDGQEVRLVSNDLARITCCMKSPKYSRVSAKAAKWIRKTYDPTYEEGTSPFNSLKNQDLVVTVIDAAKEKALSDSTVLMVDYPIKCN